MEAIGGHKMENRITKMVEKTIEEETCKVYYFNFRNSDDWTHASVMWFVSKRQENPYQNMTIEIEGGDDDQLHDLIQAYIEAKADGKRFDIDGVHFIFEQYALNEGFDIDVE